MSERKQNSGSQTIGRLAWRAGVGVTTVRFYERAGILARPPRTPANYRLYGDDALARIRFTRRAQKLGFTLAEIKELLGLRVNQKTSCADVRRLAEAKIADIKARIRSLQRMRTALQKLAEQCASGRSNSLCPILEHLETDFDP